MATPRSAKASRSYEYEQVLTPRTPHSRAGLAHGVDSHDVPLLPGDQSSKRFPDFIRRDSVSQGPFVKPLFHYLPLALGSLGAVFLFILVVLSYQRPDVLYYIVGEKEWQPYSTDTGAGPGTDTVDHPLDHGHSGHVQPSPDMLIDYSNYTQFPLTPLEYAGECWKLNQEPHSHGAFWAPGHHGVHDVMHADEPGTCTSSITYMLDGEVGIVADLALMAQLAGLARNRNRTFFVDDTYWNRGRWMDYFQDIRLTEPGPEPGCKPPPPEELVACPRLARHWVISSRTAKFHMAHDFSEEFEDPYAYSLDRQRPIFETGRTSFSSTIQPNALVSTLIQQVRTEVGHESCIGVHIRRGDQHAMSWRYKSGYVPTSEYVSAVSKAWSRLRPSTGGATHVYLATDTPSALEEFRAQAPSEWMIHSLQSSSDSRLRGFASQEPYNQEQWSKHPEEHRRALTMGMLVDLAMVGGAWPDVHEHMHHLGIVCTLMSHVCKVSAMTLGWDEAFREKKWVEIDNAGGIEPIWQAFTLYR